MALSANQMVVKPHVRPSISAQITAMPSQPHGAYKLKKSNNPIMRKSVSEKAKKQKISGSCVQGFSMNGKSKKNIVLCDSTREKRGRSGTFASLKGRSQPSFFTLFSYVPLFCCSFHSWIPGLMRKPPVSLLSFKHFFHADALMIQPYGISKRRNGVGNA